MPVDIESIPTEWINEMNIHTEDNFPTCSTQEVCKKKERVLNMSKEELNEGVDYLDKPFYTRADVFDYVDDCQEKFQDLLKSLKILRKVLSYNDFLIGGFLKIDKQIEDLYYSLYLSDVGLDYDNKK